MLNVFARDADGVHDRCATELMFTPSDPGQDKLRVDAIRPLWNVPDLTPVGRGDFRPSPVYA